MPSLKFLALQHNMISEVGKTMAFLNDLEFLDLSYNKLDAISDIAGSLPETLLFLKLRGNPMS